MTVHVFMEINSCEMWGTNTYQDDCITFAACHTDSEVCLVSVACYRRARARKTKFDSQSREPVEWIQSLYEPDSEDVVQGDSMNVYEVHHLVCMS